MPKISFTWLYLIIGGVLLFLLIFDEGNSNQRIRKSYTEVEDYIKSGYVEEITVVNNRTLEAYIFKDSTLKVAEKPTIDGSRLKVETTIGSIDNFDNFIRQQRERNALCFK